MAEPGFLIEQFNRLALSPLVVLATEAAPVELRDPRTWTSTAYLILVTMSLGLRLLMRPVSLGARIFRQLLLLLPAVFLYFLVRGTVETRRVDAVAPRRFRLRSGVARGQRRHDRNAGAAY